MFKRIRVKLLSVFLSILMTVALLPVNVSAVELSFDETPIKSISINKTLMSVDETATIQVEMQEGYKLQYISFRKPITKNSFAIYEFDNNNGVYTGEFDVTDQTESGTWGLNWIVYLDSNGNYKYLNNSEFTNLQPSADLSFLNFEVIGTDADVEPPILVDYKIDKSLVSLGETITIMVTVEEEHCDEYISVHFTTPSGLTEVINLYKMQDESLYSGTFKVDSDVEIGYWKANCIYLSDMNDNEDYIHINECDFSCLNFEVIKGVEPTIPSINNKTHIVIFKDGLGKTLSTQRVDDGESAIEPTVLANDMYLFNGWDLDFSSVKSDMVITAQWIINPDVKYDFDVMSGESFEIEVYSTAQQTYTITCSENVTFTSNLSSVGTIVSDKVYYKSGYEISVDTPGTYLFYVKGSKSSNVLTYKVKVNEQVIDDPSVEVKPGTNYDEPNDYDDEHSESNCYEMGDVNRDGKRTIQDATLLQRYIAGFIPLEESQVTLGDYDHNSIINISDVTAMQRKLAGM